MAEDQESAPVRKHRIIHWNPGTGDQQPKKRWTIWRVLKWTAGGLIGLFVVAGVTIRVVKHVLGPQVFQMIVSGRTELAPAGAEDPGSICVSQSKAELAHETVGKALAELRRMPQDHPVQMQKLIRIEKAYLGGETLLAARAYGKAYAHFDALNREIEQFTQEVKLKQEVQQAYDNILVKIRELEPARSLAAPKLEAAFAAAGAGRQFMGTGSFAAAKAQFDEGFARLQEAARALAEYIEGNLQRGQEALNRGQKEVATAAFTAALVKSPGNDVAVRGLKRAETIDRVHALLVQGDEYEKSKHYAEAAEAFGKAFSLDPLSATAQQGKARAERLGKDLEFDTAMSTAKEALGRRDWPRAIQGYEAALKVYPTKADVQKALVAARENAHRDAVRTALAKAFDFENKRLWTQARDGYAETMQLDAENADAREGYIRTGRMIRTLLEYDQKMMLAQQRADHAEFQTAINIFNEAMAIKPDYLPLTEKDQQLRALLAYQNVPVDVTFRSDGRTYVSISNFRMLGRFEVQSIKMLPGDYEIVGRRRKYQDVLLVLQVRNGSPPPVVSVVCRRSG
ncbi:MAG: hypothetical protein A3G75_06720 [Verrucomicrobia bacterium RIFCSPLOWO2_12_FULL_64_8]|nr:MAG: hypothetical protein A3G75_06720 [Verrucomicrobia bacterium RIFCSPLOWO2_12_FULL_64_8]